MSISCPPRIPGVDPYVQTAVHEMGHALMSTKGRAQLLSVEIWEEDGHVVGLVVTEVPETPHGVGVNLGRASWYSPTVWTSPEDWYDSLLTTVAGQMTEAMWLQDQFEIPLSEGLQITEETAWFDLQNFHKKAEQLRPFYPDISLRGARAEVAMHIRRRWGDVLRLSKKLATRQSLKPATVAA